MSLSNTVLTKNIAHVKMLCIYWTNNKIMNKTMRERIYMRAGNRKQSILLEWPYLTKSFLTADSSVGSRAVVA